MFFLCLLYIFYDYSNDSSFISSIWNEWLNISLIGLYLSFSFTHSHVAKHTRIPRLKEYTFVNVKTYPMSASEWTRKHEVELLFLFHSQKKGISSTLRIFFIKFCGFQHPASWYQQALMCTRCELIRPIVDIMYT